jgi:serine/threonine-protein kinase HipA
MSPSISRYPVYLGDRLTGHIYQKGDFTWFDLYADYKADPQRPVLGLIFEQDLNARHAAALRLPPWVSNLLPEGRLRDWIAADRRVSPDREMELLGQVGHDLPGGVRVLPDDMEAGTGEWVAPDVEHGALVDTRSAGWRFSLAGSA